MGFLAQTDLCTVWGSDCTLQQRESMFSMSRSSTTATNGSLICISIQLNKWRGYECTRTSLLRDDLSEFRATVTYGSLSGSVKGLIDYCSTAAGASVVPIKLCNNRIGKHFFVMNRSYVNVMNFC